MDPDTRLSRPIFWVSLIVAGLVVAVAVVVATVSTLTIPLAL